MLRQDGDLRDIARLRTQLYSRIHWRRVRPSATGLDLRPDGRGENRTGREQLHVCAPVPSQFTVRARHQVSPGRGRKPSQQVVRSEAGSMEIIHARGFEEVVRRRLLHGDKGFTGRGSSPSRVPARVLWAAARCTNQKCANPLEVAYFLS